MPQLRADAREAALTVDDRTDQQDNRTIARRLVMELAQGCGDHSCRFNKPSGMGTNGGCRCIDKIEDALSRRSTVPSSDGLAKFLEDVVHLARLGIAGKSADCRMLTLRMAQRARKFDEGLSERLIEVAPVRPEDFMRSTVTPAHAPHAAWIEENQEAAMTTEKIEPLTDEEIETLRQPVTSEFARRCIARIDLERTARQKAEERVRVLESASEDVVCVSCFWRSVERADKTFLLFSLAMCTECVTSVAAGRDIIRAALTTDPSKEG
jgi:hypothetical protein